MYLYHLSNEVGEFQLHHTGIKTLQNRSDSRKQEDFNCTIQELKHIRTVSAPLIAAKFQLHHTGIKTKPEPLRCRLINRFQLHHTGIKTRNEVLAALSQTKFQLHHTGIKTPGGICETSYPALISIAPYRN